jgi:hypothetical protein
VIGGGRNNRNPNAAPVHRTGAAFGYGDPAERSPDRFIWVS